MFQIVRWGLVASLALAGCGKKDDGSDDESEESSGGVVPSVAKGSVASVNALASAVPSSMAVSAFPKSTSASLSLQDGDDQQISEKIEEQESVLKGEATNCFSGNLFASNLQGATPTCYNFDSDLNPFRSSQTNDGDRGTVDGTVGNGDTEACLVAFARAEMQESISKVDTALALVAGLICQAKKDGAATKLPSIGSSLDLSTSLSKAVSETVNEAKVTRLADQGGQAVFQTDISVKDDENRTIEVHLVHSPGTDDDNYVGTLWTQHTGFHQSSGGNDPNNVANKNDVMSINYSRETVEAMSRMRLEVRQAQIVNSIEPFTDAGLVNYAGIPENAQNDTVHAIRYVAFDMNPDNNEGNLAYWQNPGGNYSEAARGFLFNLDSQSDGSLAGCGVSGATSNLSIRKNFAEADSDPLEPVRYYHPLGDSNSHPDKDDRYGGQEGNKITKQCFKQNSSSGAYAIDTDKTSHARGYDVVEVASSGIEPPQQPSDAISGDFVKD